MLLKEKIKNKQKLIGMHINLNDIATARIAGLAGFDFIWVDLEHNNLTLENLLGHILAIKATGTAVIVRVPVDDLTYTKKVLEMGPDGIIFPMVKTAEQAEKLISATLYPPYGTRGFGPMNATAYGFEDVNEYIKETRDNMCRFIQIEHVDAVNNLEEITQNEYIDGYIFGANDLSGSIGELGQVFAENTVQLIQKSIYFLRKKDKYIGLSTGDTSETTLAFWHNMGVDMLSAGADFNFLQQSALRTRISLEKIHKNSTADFKKVFYTKENLTKDVNCALNPPLVFGAEVGNWDYYSAEKRKWQSAPCICKLDDKTLYCTFSGDNFGGDEEPNNYNVIMKSTDGGQTWKTVTVIDHTDSVRVHEPILWKDGDGVIWHFWAQSYNWWDGRGGVWAMTLQSPENNTWSKPRRICDGVMATPPITLSNGDIMLPVSIWKKFKGTIHSYPNWGNSAVYISKDKGKSFAYVGGANERNTTFDENAIVERADGSLFMIMRCFNRISYSISLDKGETWTEPQKLMDHTSARSFLAKFPSGNYLLVTNDDTKERRNMTAFLSTDGCKTWDKKLLLDERNTVSYPAGCIDEKGRVYVAYDYSRCNEEEIYFATFTEKDILNGEILEDGSMKKRLIVKGKSGKPTEKVFENGETFF